MLNEIQLKKYADVLFWGLTTARKGKFKKGDLVLIQYDPAAVRLVEILQARILEMGMNPVMRIAQTYIMEQNFYKKADEKQLVFLTPGDKELYGHVNGRIYLRAPDSLTHLSTVDSTRIGRALVARKVYREIMNKREDQGIYGWTLCTLPTGELAKQARLSVKQYTDQIVKACYLDKKDPVGEWKRIYREVGAIKKWLNSLKIKHLLIESDSMDIRITPGEKRKWLGVSGHNIPSFEIFLSPDWRGTEGVYYANQPSFRSGNYVESVKLEFKKGSVAKVMAGKGRKFIEQQLAMDAGAGKVGEFSLTDRRFSRIDRFMADTLFDENFGGKFGNCHLAVGSSYSDTYAGNPAELTEGMKKKLGFNDSALHWDLVNTEDKVVTAQLTSGATKIIYDSGMFKY